MPRSEPSSINLLQLYRQPCRKCGTPMMLARIEPAAQAGHDLRTFECSACGHNETEDVKYA